MSKTFLFPVLAIAALGLPAWGDVTEYCGGTNPNCSTFSQTAFNNTVSSDDYTYAGLLVFNSTNGVLNGDTYTDDLTGISFVDFSGGGPSGNFTDTGGTLSSPVGDYTIAITIPDTYLAIVFSINVGGGLCENYCPEGQTTGFVGFINTGSPTSPWTVDIGPAGTNHTTEILNFDAASAASDLGGGSASTPEVGTLLLIGAGLISMRWMKRWPRKVFRTLQPA